MRLSKAPVYPQHSLELAETAQNPERQSRNPPLRIDEIKILDHQFDRQQRKRTKRSKPIGLSDLFCPSKGVEGVRVHHKVNEEKLNQVCRLGDYSSKQLPPMWWMCITNTEINDLLSSLMSIYCILKTVIAALQLLVSGWIIAPASVIYGIWFELWRNVHYSIIRSRSKGIDNKTLWWKMYLFYMF